MLGPWDAKNLYGVVLVVSSTWWQYWAEWGLG